MEYVGFREVIGSWKMMEIFPPLMCFMTPSPDPTSSFPSNLMEEPSLILPVVARICITEYAVTDFPDPDSPTMPRTFPWSRLKDTPFTAFTSPASVKKLVCRFLTSKSAISSSFLTVELRVERISQSITEKVKGKDDERNHHSWNHQTLRI